VSAPNENTRDAVRSSALWAAFGDALGFISELAEDESLIVHRTGSPEITHLVSWQRRIGGKFGINPVLPAGCYSDDTQLRLSTARAIRGNGTFDVAVFSKIEVPIWLAYALGGGRGSKAAAYNLARPEVTWNSNFYDSDGLRYVSGGGNGAAMRIQPHVWSSGRDRPTESLLGDVLRNAITTHGHPRGLLGACFHALSLRYAIGSNTVPEHNVWHRILEELAEVPNILRADDELRDMWIPLWERESHTTLEEAFATTLAECRADVELVAGTKLDEPAKCYRELTKALGAMSGDARGSGTKTAILANALALLFADSPSEGLLVSANHLGSDTDTIATMAGAIMGAAFPHPPPGTVIDIEYILDEADRLYRISQGERTASFRYPDLLTWQVPRSSIDAVSISDDGIIVAGLGKGVPHGKPIIQQGRTPACWQWVKLDFGQSLFVRRRVTEDVRGFAKRRDEPIERAPRSQVALFERPKDSAPPREFNIPAQEPQVVLREPTQEFDRSQRTDRLQRTEDTQPPDQTPPVERSEESVERARVAEQPRPDRMPTPPVDAPAHGRVNRNEEMRISSTSMDELTDEVIRVNFDPLVIGSMLLAISKRPDGIEMASTFSVIVAKAIRARYKRGNGH